MNEDRMRCITSTTTSLTQLRDLERFLKQNVMDMQLQEIKKSFDEEKISQFREEYPFLLPFLEEMKRMSLRKSKILFQKRRKRIQNLEKVLVIEIFLLVGALFLNFEMDVKKLLDPQEIQIEEEFKR